MNQVTQSQIRPKPKILPKVIPIALLLTIIAVAITITARNANAQTSSVPNLPATLYNYEDPNLPAHFLRRQIANRDNTPAFNPVTDEGATLGRVLFYDVRLSANDTTSCASCHLQSKAFADVGATSVGFNGGHTNRNSMGLSNARYYPNGNFFWDERAGTLEEQVLMPIEDSVEMGLDLDIMEAKLANTSYYPDLFEDAFGDDEITSERVGLALAQFIRSMVSYQSKYDAGVATNFNNFTNQEERGMNLFEGRARCDRCHITDIQIATQARNNGLDRFTTDPGVAGVTGNQRDDAEFKVPSLRNIELTGPYMHDGRFATLEEVVDFYNSDVQNHPNLDNNLTGGRNGRGGRGRGRNNNGNQARNLNLNQRDQAALVAFMETLTDNAFISDPKFSDPFQ